jgi:hypothetical protein
MSSWVDKEHGYGYCALSVRLGEASFGSSRFRLAHMLG